MLNYVFKHINIVEAWSKKLLSFDVCVITWVMMFRWINKTARNAQFLKFMLLSRHLWLNITIQYTIVLTVYSNTTVYGGMSMAHLITCHFHFFEALYDALEIKWFSGLHFKPPNFLKTYFLMKELQFGKPCMYTIIHIWYGTFFLGGGGVTY